MNDPVEVAEADVYSRTLYAPATVATYKLRQLDALAQRPDATVDQALRLLREGA